MPFKDILQTVVDSVEGAVGAVVMGYDGIAIDDFVKKENPFDLQLLTAEYAAVLKEVKGTVEVLKSGLLQEVSINTELSIAIARVINEDFFVLLVITGGGNFGKGRFYLRREAPKLAEALQ
ncbi:roadblock/LC7 domain-containing protein [Geotalea toluenoxydans]|uniref:roadblock/LC7 domain-containing protein n=1 Tax=Geotalea toluenoxydans TaxID=421624 RepID=UPI0006D227AC|nr:hypothetical protein [Geotalea toluenoxydans]